VLSLAVNLNHWMRFDGYQLFGACCSPTCRSARSPWDAGGEMLFGYGDEQPEPATAGRRRLFV
jgi:hypothetical protein